MEAIGVLTERIRQAERRIDANHESIGKVRNDLAKDDVELAVISADLEDIHEDLNEIKGSIKWMMRGLWAAAGTFLMFAIALAGVVVHG